MNCYCWFHVIRIIFNFLTFVTRLALRYSEDCWKSIDGIRTIRNKMMKTLKKLIKKIILTWTIDIMELECASNYAGNFTYYYTNQWNQLFSARMCRFLHRWKFMCNIYRVVHKDWPGAKWPRMTLKPFYSIHFVLWPHIATYREGFGTFLSTSTIC